MDPSVWGRKPRSKPNSDCTERHTVWKLRRMAWTRAAPECTCTHKSRVVFVKTFKQSRPHNRALQNVAVQTELRRYNH